jgi:hypothetical protein
MVATDGSGYLLLLSAFISIPLVWVVSAIVLSLVWTFRQTEL